MKHKHREVASAKRPTKTKIQSTPGVVRPKPRQVIIVFDEKASADVEARRDIKNVSLDSIRFPVVRRNKKIQKVIRMGKMRSKTEAKVQIVTSKKGALTDINCLYDKHVIKALQYPHAFNFRRVKELREVVVWNVMTAKSTSVILQTDHDQDAIRRVHPDLLSDVGVLKKAVEKLLASSANDVVAINTHPGHHAGPRTVANHCTVNYIACAASLIKRRNPSLRVGVIDVDIHPGDGTQQFVEQHPRLIDKFVSIHCAGHWWFMNSRLGANGITLKLNNRRMVSPQRFMDQISNVLEMWNRESLHVIIVALGFDTLKLDPCDLGWQMLPVHFSDIGHVLSQRPEQIFFIQEGGYHLNETASAFGCLVKGFRKGRHRLDHGATSGLYPSQRHNYRSAETIRV